jgi:hypothetical protein
MIYVATFTFSSYYTTIAGPFPLRLYPYLFKFDRAAAAGATCTDQFNINVNSLPFLLEG